MGQPLRVLTWCRWALCAYRLLTPVLQGSWLGHVLKSSQLPALTSMQKQLDTTHAKHGKKSASQFPASEILGVASKRSELRTARIEPSRVRDLGPQAQKRVQLIQKVLPKSKRIQRKNFKLAERPRKASQNKRENPHKSAKKTLLSKSSLHKSLDTLNSLQVCGFGGFRFLKTIETTTPQARSAVLTALSVCIRDHHSGGGICQQRLPRASWVQLDSDSVLSKPPVSKRRGTCLL